MPDDSYYVRDAHGRFVKAGKKADLVSEIKSSTPPLVNFQITNPVTYLKLWWSRIMRGEGIDFRFRAHPVTAFVITAIIASAAFGLGRLTLPAPIIQYLPILASPPPSPTPDPWKETAYQGTLRFSSVTQKYYLSTTSSQAITLEVPPSIDLAKLVGKKIFAVGKYNSKTDILIVADAASFVVLPNTPIPVPVISPSPTPARTPTATSEPTETPAPIP
jgi:hypothetical protein